MRSSSDNIDMTQVNTDGVCLLADTLGAVVDEWYDLPLTEYVKTPLFAELMTKNASTYGGDYIYAFGDLTVDQVPAAVARLDHGTIHTEERVALTALSGLMVVMVGLRLYSRVVYLTGSLRSDDYFIIGAMILTLGTQVLNYLFITYGGNGKHIYDVTQHEQANNLKLDYALDVEINLAFFLLKISFLLFYRTLSQSKLFQRACFALGLFMTATSIALEIASIFECIPFDVWKDPSTVWQHCSNVIDRQYFQAAFSCLTDFALLCLPMSVVFKVRVRKASDRIGMLFMFGIGGLICVVGILRCTLTFPYLKDIDWTRNGPMFMFYYVLELQLGVIINSLPALRAFFRHMPLSKCLPFHNSHRPTSSRKKSGATSESNPDSTYVSETEKKRRVSFARMNLKWLKDAGHAGHDIDTFTQTGTGTGRGSRRTWRSLGSFNTRTNYNTQRSSFTTTTQDERGGELQSPTRTEKASILGDFTTRMSREDMAAGLSRVHSSESDISVELVVQDHNGRRMSAISMGSRSGAATPVERSNPTSTVNLSDIISRSTSPVARENQLESINESEIAFSGLAPRPPPRAFQR